MTDVTTLIDGYIAMWNETDPRAPPRARRRGRDR